MNHFNRIIYDTTLLKLKKTLPFLGLGWPYNWVKDKYWLLPGHAWLKTAVGIFVYVCMCIYIHKCLKVIALGDSVMKTLMDIGTSKKHATHFTWIADVHGSLDIERN